ncbi:Uncharacterised protein [Mycobacterium tuberculosis]|uniref:Uncharacterized protein n=1 Tax=Mycobacterium tuberculosis TaxID=1773 RepID=A0A916PB62_MYCTX|nr:Uncharacterised protein [Mycobacterium tuberculosis]
MQLVSADRFQAVSVGVVLPHQGADRGQIAFGHSAHRAHYVPHLRIRQCVNHPFAVPAAGHQAGAPKLQQVLGGIGKRQPRRTSQRVHTAFTLHQQIQQLQSMAAGQRLPDQGELLEDQLLCTGHAAAPFLDSDVRIFN